MPIPRPVKAVTFDCWSTLISDTSWEQTMLRRQQSLLEVAASCGRELTDRQAEELISESWQEHMKAWRAGQMYGAPGAARWILDKLALSNHPRAEDLAERLTLGIESGTSGVGTYLLHGAAEAVDAVRSAGLATALVCDTGFTPARFVRRFLAEHDIKLDYWFFSDEVGTPKPYPPIFQAALDATGVEAGEAVHIGDLKRTDIAGARAMGMGTIRYTGLHDDTWSTEDTAGEEADVVMEHWSELESILGL